MDVTLFECFFFKPLAHRYELCSSMLLHLATDATYISERRFAAAAKFYGSCMQGEAVLGKMEVVAVDGENSSAWQVSLIAPWTPWQARVSCIRISCSNPVHTLYTLLKAVHSGTKGTRDMHVYLRNPQHAYRFRFIAPTCISFQVHCSELTGCASLYLVKMGRSHGQLT
jgi:hypothetical protein